jgi:hypothetical protein
VDYPWFEEGVRVVGARDQRRYVPPPSAQAPKAEAIGGCWRASRRRFVVHGPPRLPGFIAWDHRAARRGGQVRCRVGVIAGKMSVCKFSE